MLPGYEKIPEGGLEAHLENGHYGRLDSHVSRCCGLRRSTLLLWLYVLLYAAYLVVGSLVFTALEADLEDDFRRALQSKIMLFLNSYDCVSDEALEELLAEVVEANNRGVSVVHNVSSEPNWSFGQSLFFSGTVITTIGYGHVTPLSRGGKIFCMVYAVLGIPLTLILLSALVERLMIPATLMLQALNSRLGHLYQPFNIRLFHLALVGLLAGAFFFLLPAAIFTQLEPDWDYLDAFYYCFISLTTIGLGDYIPGDSPNQPYRPLYKVCITGYLLVGLTFMMLALTVFYDIPQLNFGTFFLLRADEQSLDPEKMRLQAPGSLGPKYTQHMDEPVMTSSGGGGNVSGGTSSSGPHVVRIKSRRDDSPSPEETTPVHARP